MNISRATIKLLSGFRSLSSEVIVSPSSRFFIFGEGNNKQHLGAAVEGRIREKVERYEVFQIPKPNDFKLTRVAKIRYDPERKVHFFNELLEDTVEIASFFIDSKTKKEIGKTNQEKPTHIRFWRKAGTNVFARPFNGRRYYRELIEEKLDTHKLFHLSDFSGENFLVYVDYQTFKIMKPASYGASVLGNGIMILFGHDNDLTYYFRDQRLGDEWQNEIEDTIIGDTALLFEPRRAQSIRHSIKTAD